MSGGYDCRIKKKHFNSRQKVDSEFAADASWQTVPNNVEPQLQRLGCRLILPTIMPHQRDAE